MIFQQKKWNIVVCDICHTFDHTYCKGCQPKLRQYFVTRIFHQKIKKKNVNLPIKKVFAPENKKNLVAASPPRRHFCDT